VTLARVYFYLLSASDQRARLLAACRLAEKGYDQGLRVTVRTDTPAEAAELDDLLWTFADRSFVPHAVWPADPDLAAESPVLIASAELPDSHRDVLVNLGAEVPSGFEHYVRLCEIVTGDEAARAAGRVRWRCYRDAGLAPQSHPL
jgi:DNA polymerase-3 subunit chi